MLAVWNGSHRAGALADSEIPAIDGALSDYLV